MYNAYEVSAFLLMLQCLDTYSTPEYSEKFYCSVYFQDYDRLAQLCRGWYAYHNSELLFRQDTWAGEDDPMFKCTPLTSCILQKKTLFHVLDRYKQGDSNSQVITIPFDYEDDTELCELFSQVDELISEKNKAFIEFIFDCYSPYSSAKLLEIVSSYYLEQPRSINPICTVDVLQRAFRDNSLDPESVRIREFLDNNELDVYKMSDDCLTTPLRRI